MKKILFLILVVLGIFIPLRVSALESSFYEGEYLPNFYIKKFKNGSGKYEQMRVFRRNSDNKVAYCIELWESLNVNKSLPGYDTNQASLANLSSSTWNRIMLIAYYGYGYLNHTDIKWYGITQVMIWMEIDKDSTIYFTDTLNGNKVDMYTYEMNEINDLVNKHNIQPSFSNLYRFSLNETRTLTDTNNALNNYNVSVTSDLKYTRNNNQITLTPTQKDSTYLVLYKRDNLYNNKPTVFIDDNGQNLLLPGSYDAIYKNVVINVPSGNITVNKYDDDTKSSVNSGDASFNDVTFSLYDLNDNLIATNKINDNNKIIFTNIPYGKYYIREIYPGDGYIYRNQEKIYITLDDNNNSIDFYNYVRKNTIKIHKYLKKYDGTILEETAKFIVLNSKNEEILNFETDDNGYYEFILPYGKYTIKQVSGTKNYKFIDDLEINVESNLITQEFNLYNNEIVVPIKITNLDSGSLLPILESGAIFKIRNIDTNDIVNLTTNDSGETDIINLANGTYEIEQVKVVDNYIISKDKVVLNIDEDNYSFTEDVKNIDIINDKELSNIEVKKLINYYFNDKLIDTKSDDNIKIAIYAKEDIYTKDGNIRYKKDEEVDVVSKSNNLISKNLIYGNYYIKNPDNNKIIDIALDSLNAKEVKIVEDVYKYGKEINNIPDTYTTDNSNNYLNLSLVLIGLLFVYKGKKDEIK